VGKHALHQQFFPSIFRGAVPWLVLVLGERHAILHFYTSSVARLLQKQARRVAFGVITNNILYDNQRCIVLQVRSGTSRSE